jgi:hypothetical protein
MPIEEVDVKGNVVQEEPVLTAGVVVSLIIALASIFNVEIDPTLVETIVLAGLPLVGSIFARSKVVPEKKVKELKKQV